MGFEKLYPESRKDSPTPAVPVFKRKQVQQEYPHLAISLLTKAKQLNLPELQSQVVHPRKCVYIQHAFMSVPMKLYLGQQQVRPADCTK